ncbi:undecaprenyl-diphosphatase [Lactobacillus nasalidis]|uniref:Undecaprenyl-diphosphatase n=1 Tax=Lactobacillus nasalidis TaxID=2797258 RepID=A0ABQ3W653_9LACO|nr:undecaprenyl-diphosphate phosphatase [Lactobacillus nasalidis]GHV96992.1 undecaprenyl-diphosphatase [Lactobacillus nasalidis]GHV99016.1 undecaprenyl-diphosphatase [Lactobacillus nasalidis]GHW02041.1 undecaprenyl-diphosphatase [Lactobacillus nasalidis]
MLDILKAVILGIIEGLSEFLPISSTGHLYLANYVIKLGQPTSFVNMFMVVIQLGAIMSVVVLYFNKLNPFAKSKSGPEKRATWLLWFKVLLAVLPAVVIGLPLNDWLDKNMTSWQVISATLIIYGILFIILENFYAKRLPTVTKLSDLSWRFAILIGCFQVLSLIPGTSRSGATILGAMLLGASRYVATEFSFFLAIPTMFGASLLKLVKFFKAGGVLAGSQLAILLTGMVVSFLVAYLAIKFLLKYVQTHDFKPFGYYRIILGLLVILCGLFLRA